MRYKSPHIGVFDSTTGEIRHVFIYRMLVLISSVEAQPFFYSAPSGVTQGIHGLLAVPLRIFPGDGFIFCLEYGLSNFCHIAGGIRFTPILIPL